MNPIMLVVIIGMVIYILYLQAVIAGKVNALKCAKMLYIKAMNKMFVECGISKALEMRKVIEAEVAKEMGLKG